MSRKYKESLALNGGSELENESEVSADESADWELERDGEPQKFIGPGFTCSDCGEHIQVVERVSTILHWRETVVPCHCEGGGRIAGLFMDVWAQKQIERGVLDNSHRWQVTETEAMEDEPPGNGTFMLTCPRCYCDPHNYHKDENGIGILDTVDYGVQSRTSEIEYFVRCAGCLRELEFGWSHPGRIGPVWPCENGDFDPCDVWPEPRYAQAWKERGWRHPWIEKGEINSLQMAPLPPETLSRPSAAKKAKTWTLPAEFWHPGKL